MGERKKDPSERQAGRASDRQEGKREMVCGRVGGRLKRGEVKRSSKGKDQ